MKVDVFSIPEVRAMLAARDRGEIDGARVADLLEHARLALRRPRRPAEVIAFPKQSDDDEPPPPTGA